ncbi:MAG: hypothetical protein AAFZ65_00830 [Planctomycetota bacterium]
MSDGSIPRPASASLQPILSVLARTLVGGGEGGQLPSGLLPSASAASPSPATLPLPATSAVGSVAATVHPVLPTEVPAWARALAAVAPAGQPLGEALGELTRLLSERGLERALPGPEGWQLAEALRTLSDLDGFDGSVLRERLGSVGLALEAHLAQAAPERVGGEGKPLEPGEQLGLKAQLLRARSAAPEAEVRQRIERVLASLDGEQLHNLARAEHGEPPLEHLPIPDRGGWSTAWFQRRGGGGEGEGGADDAGASLTVGLTLSALGPIRLDLALAPDLLRVRVAVSDARTRAALERGLDGLLVELERVGRPVAIGVELAPPEDLAPPSPVVDGQLDVAA